MTDAQLQRAKELKEQIRKLKSYEEQRGKKQEVEVGQYITDGALDRIFALADADVAEQLADAEAEFAAL